MEKELEKIDFCRICELVKGQKFRYVGVWRLVVGIEDGRLNYCDIKDGYYTNYKSIGAKSKEFVEIIKPPATS
jgi:hypothetical protein